MRTRALKKYKEKRDFDRTAEPPPKVKRSGKKLKFVIQKHAATRLHYDLRLEWDGVYLSWAVPKGPSLNPEDRRLAVEVEDHPLDYGRFEGIIPANNYGAGEVIVWDRGQWIPEKDVEQGLAKGHLQFELVGEKLGGSWMLVRFKEDDNGKATWFLRKLKDKVSTTASGDSILKRKPRSVISGKTIEDIQKLAKKRVANG